MFIIAAIPTRYIAAVNRWNPAFYTSVSERLDGKLHNTVNILCSPRCSTCVLIACMCESSQHLCPGIHTLNRSFNLETTI